MLSSMSDGAAVKSADMAERNFDSGHADTDKLLILLSVASVEYVV